MPRILLLLPTATYRASDFLDAADAVGAEIVIASERRQAMADQMGGRFVAVPIRQPERAAARIVEHAAEVPLDAIVAVDDQGVVVSALASAQLGLPHNPPDAVRATRDKASLRRALAGHVRQAEFRIAGPGDDVADLATSVGFPAVIKPVSLSASRGVIRVDTPEEARAAGARIRHILDCADEPGAHRDGPLLVESFVPGVEVAVEALLRGGDLEVLAIFDKPDPLDGPYFEETIYTTPSRLPTATQEAISRTTGEAARALGLEEGPVHAELRITPEGDVVFLEIAARSIGGLCARALRFGLGITLEEVILRHALGQEPSTLSREPGASGVMMIPIPAEGTLEDVRGQDGARQVPGIVGLAITITRGRPVQPLPDGDRYLGFLFARADSPEEVEAALREAHSRLDIVIGPPDAATSAPDGAGTEPDPGSAPTRA